MRQDSFPDAGFETCPKKTRKEQFMEDMETIIPWQELSETPERQFAEPFGAEEQLVRIHAMREHIGL